MDHKPTLPATSEAKLPPFLPPPPPPPKNKKKTAYEKRLRQSGKNTDKPYISSSLGDICRLMTRMACTENTLNMTDPPPAEFYDFWHKFTITSSKSKENLPTNYVDTRRVSIPRLKMNTSSFELMTRNQAASIATMQVQDSGGAGSLKISDPTRKLAPALSDLWKNVRTSMSSESFISSSTKVSEPHDNVGMEIGWSDDEEEAFVSDSDDDVAWSSHTSSKGIGGGAAPAEGQNPVYPHPSSVTQAPSCSKQGSNDGSYEDLETKQRKEIGAVAASILKMEMEEARIAMEMAIKGDLKERDIIDHFMNDLDDSFLIDAVSYGLLPDSAFIEEFDYFNEDPIYREREKERKVAEALMAIQGKGKTAEKLKAKAKAKGKKGASVMSIETSDTESELTSIGTQSGLISVANINANTASAKDDYQTCLDKQRKRIEDNIRAAARSRSPMGSYRVPPDGLPLARTFAFVSPGPADYLPKLNAVKPNPVGVFFAKRWTKSIYETPGPGPAAYVTEFNQCTCQMINLHDGSPRFETSESVGPGPGAFNVSPFGSTGKDKPHARIVSRRPELKVGCGSSKMTNIFGMTRFGRRRPPNALIVSRYWPNYKDKREPGPGSYEPYPPTRTTKVGIKMKSRIPVKYPTDQPEMVNLPGFIGHQPGVPFGIRKFEDIYADSPGPNYNIPSPDPKPVSMTFKPFLMPGREEEPSPIHYGTVPGDQCIKMTKPKAPVTVMCGDHDLKYGSQTIPGPKYKIKDCKCKLPITFKGKYEFKVDKDLPGPDYYPGTSHLPVPPKAVFQCPYKHKPLLERSPGYKYTPTNPSYSHTKGGLMSNKWPEREETEESGPDFYDLSGFTNQGKYSKIPISLRSRQSPFVFSHLSENTEILKQDTCDVTARPKRSPKQGNC